ncbi:glutathione ABC transporter substrate-binding protein [Salibacterium halotolerans]|uniref:Peptide/nickel transport system substrate-binding protein n=1 Tax=Salibacterium halotolerans TaxID=1884432 RepID=A0A1I5RIS5_9BACI|nr:glutathione ABC transporter substrate-binding protein [Salibacterium halotolerans]SFP58425.1 peptide/nickel transport system substrate-binding protein [Salibacterium halotolerans]
MKLSLNIFRTFFLAVLFSLVLTACASEPEQGGGDSGSSEDTGSSEEGGQSADAGGSTSQNLVIGTSAAITGLSPQGSNDQPSSNVQTNIFETLVTQNENMEIQPNLATEWEQTSDTTWEFTLREDVTFTDGTEFNAEAVKATFDRIRDEEIGSPRAFLYEMVTEVNVIDDHTVEFVTEYPFSPLPAHLAHNGGGIISPKVIEKDYEMMEQGESPGSYIDSHPVGTGMFKVENWDAGNQVVLTRNKDYWGEKPGVKQVTFRVTTEDLTRVAELETGKADIIHPVSPSDTSRVENMENAGMYTQNSLSMSYIGFNTQKEPFNNKKVRRALSMAVNKEEIMQGVYGGAATKAIAPIGENVFGFSDQVEGLPYDPEQAKQLLAEAGYEDGFSTTIWTNDNRQRRDIAAIVQQQLSQIGVDVKIEVLEWGTYLDSTSNGEHDMFILGWSTVTGDADYGMYPLFHSKNVGAPGNRSFYKNEEVDKLLDQARREGNREERKALYEDAMNVLVEDSPMIYMLHKDYLVGVSDKVEGFWVHPNGLYQLQNVSISE